MSLLQRRLLQLGRRAAAAAAAAAAELRPGESSAPARRRRAAPRRAVGAARRAARRQELAARRPDAVGGGVREEACRERAEVGAEGEDLGAQDGAPAERRRRVDHRVRAHLAQRLRAPQRRRGDGRGAGADGRDAADEGVHAESDRRGAS